MSFVRTGHLFVEGHYVSTAHLPGTVSVTDVKKEKKTDKVLAKATCTADWTATGVTVGSTLRFCCGLRTFDATVIKKLATEGEFALELHGGAAILDTDVGKTVEIKDGKLSVGGVDRAVQ